MSIILEEEKLNRGSGSLVVTHYKVVVSSAVHLGTDGSDLIQTSNDSSRSLFELKSERSLPKWMAGWTHYNSVVSPSLQGPRTPKSGDCGEGNQRNYEIFWWHYP